jgi:hypothetical protein
MDGKYYDPGVYVLVGKLGVSWSLSQRADSCKKPLKEFERLLHWVVVSTHLSRVEHHVVEGTYRLDGRIPC